MCDYWTQNMPKAPACILGSLEAFVSFWGLSWVARPFLGGLACIMVSLSLCIRPEKAVAAEI